MFLNRPWTIEERLFMAKNAGYIEEKDFTNLIYDLELENPAGIIPTILLAAMTGNLKLRGNGFGIYNYTLYIEGGSAAGLDWPVCSGTTPEIEDWFKKYDIDKNTVHKLLNMTSY